MAWHPAEKPAVATETGRSRWQFFAEGPVRFAPVAWRDNVYFVSDDGWLYCVAAADGTLRWKFHGIPPGKQERKLFGHGRLISLWPARGGPVLEGGVLYFGVGLWSSYGVCVHALDAASGRPLWSNTDSNHIPKANMDHGVGNYAGLAPHGYLAVVHDKLVVPCGTQLPAFLDLKTGVLGTYCMGWGGRHGLPKGTWFVAGSNHYLSHGGDLYDLSRPSDDPPGNTRSNPPYKNFLYAGGWTRLRIAPTNFKGLEAFDKPVFSPDQMYEHGIVAYDLADASIAKRSKTPPSPNRKDDFIPDTWQTTFRELWKLPSELRVHIKAGRHLYLGGLGVIEAVRVPQPGEEPAVVWRATIKGTPESMVAADGKLFVATREGALYAFGEQRRTAPIKHAAPATSPAPADAWTRTAARMLRDAKVRDGYALALGVGTSRLIEELINQSKLDVIAIESDAKVAAECRQRLARRGLYGTRATIHVGDPLSYPLPPYLASLVVSEDWAKLGLPQRGRELIERIFHPLRPYGGTACFAVPAAQRTELAKEIAACGLPGAAVRQTGDWVLLSRDGPLPDAADWSHAAAEAANTGASKDRFLKGPLEMLWFGAPPGRCLKAVGATLVCVCGGRVIIKNEMLQATDVYTGRRLWQTTLPFPHKLTDQLVALDDAIYVTGGAACLVVDPATGRQKGQIVLPAGMTNAWANLRVSQDHLVAQSGRHLVCVHRRSGRLVWKRECQRPQLSIAVGGGKVFCAELIKPRGETEDQHGRTRAFDLETGKLHWQIAAGSELRYSQSLDLIATASAVYRAGNGSLVAALADRPIADPKAQPSDLPRSLFLVGEKLFYGTGENVATYDLHTGSRVGEAMTWRRRGCTVPRASSNLITTRVLGNAACIEMATRNIIPLWNVRAACSNNLFPADGVLNMPGLMAGCTCNYLPVSQAFVPAHVIDRASP